MELGVKTEERKKRLFFWGMLIKELREAKGMSQRALSKESGVSRNTIRKIEALKTDPSITAVELLLFVLGHELEAFEFEEKPSEPLLDLHSAKGTVTQP